MADETTRRQLLREGAAVAGAAAALGAMAPLASAAAPAQSESQVLTHALQIEQLLVIAYRQALASGVVVSPTVKDQLETQLGQEVEHVAILKRVFRANALVPPAAPSVAAAQTALTGHQVHWSLTHLRSQHDALKLLVDVESLAENAYFQAIGTVKDVALAGTCTELMGCEAQHWSVISGFLNHHDPLKAVPYPFVEGTP